MHGNHKPVKHRDPLWRNPQLRSSQAAAGIDDFFDAVGEGIALHLKAEGNPNGMSPQYVHEFPKERLAQTDQPFDLVVFRVLKSMMAPTSNDGNRVPRGPSLREDKPHPNLENYNLVTAGWWELAQVEFSIFSRSNEQADVLTLWFHQFMMKYAFAYKFFTSRGVDYFRFVSRADDDLDLSTAQEIYRRRLVYEIRIENLIAFEKKALESVTLNIGINRTTDTIELPVPDPQS